MSEPASVEAERAVIGALMIQPEAYWRVADKLRPEDFYDPDMARVFAYVGQACRERRTIDIFLVAEGVGSTLAPTLIQCANATPGAANIAGYAEIVASKAELRRLRAAGRQIAAMESGGSAEASELVSRAARPAVHSIRSVKQVLREFHSGLANRSEKGDEITGVTWGVDQLDAITGGMQPGDLVLIAARPSMCKTAFALQVARAAAGSGAGVLVFTLEMSAEQLMGRLVSSVAHVSGDGLRRPADMDESSWARISAATARIVELPIRFDESPTLTLDSLLAKTRQAHAASPVRIVVIDYLQLVTPPNADRVDIGLGVITRSLKALAKDIGATVVLLSQLNRKCEERSDKRPILSDMRDSGAIEQDADIVAMLYRDEYYNPQSVDKGFMEVLLRKHRNGAVGMVPCHVNLRFGIFNGSDALPSQSMPQEEKRGWNGKSMDHKRNGASKGFAGA